MALLTELFIQIVHSREFVWLTFRVLAIRRGEKLTLDMYRRSTTTSLETNPFSQRIHPLCCNFAYHSTVSVVGHLLVSVLLCQNFHLLLYFLIVRHFQVSVANFLHIRDDLLVSRQ